MKVLFPTLSQSTDAVVFTIRKRDDDVKSVTARRRPRLLSLAHRVDIFTERHFPVHVSFA